MSGLPYHPDEPRDVVREDWRAGRTSAQAKRALAAKAVRKFICEHPGCTKEDICASGITKLASAIQFLQSRKLVRFEFPDAAGKKRGQARWYVRQMEGVE